MNRRVRHRAFVAFFVRAAADVAGQADQRVNGQVIRGRAAVRHCGPQDGFVPVLAAGQAVGIKLIALAGRHDLNFGVNGQHGLAEADKAVGIARRVRVADLPAAVQLIADFPQRDALSRNIAVAHPVGGEFGRPVARIRADLRLCAEQPHQRQILIGAERIRFNAAPGMVAARRGGRDAGRRRCASCSRWKSCPTSAGSVYARRGQRVKRPVKAFQGVIGKQLYVVHVHRLAARRGRMTRRDACPLGSDPAGSSQCRVCFCHVRP